MGKTLITPQLLHDKGFKERIMFGQIVYYKEKIALVYSFAWLPCNYETGEPLSTNVYISTWEEFEKIMQEGGVK